MFKHKPQRDGHGVDTLIGPQVTIQGDIVFSGGLHVEGRIQGKVLAAAGEQAVLTLAESGCIEGEITAPAVIINGQLVGNVHASDRIELASKARVQGDVHYQVVQMSAGAQLTGRLVHARGAPEQGGGESDHG